MTAVAALPTLLCAVPLVPEGLVRPRRAEPATATKAGLNLRKSFVAGREQGKLRAELDDARCRGEVQDVELAFASTAIDNRGDVSSSWAQVNSRFSNSRGIFGIQLGVTLVDADGSPDPSGAMCRLVARVKPLVMTYGKSDDGERDSHRYWAARFVFEIGCSGELLAVVPDHRSVRDENDGKKKVKEVCIGTFPSNDGILSEAFSASTIGLSVHLRVEDAGGPLEEEFQFQCGCCG